MPRGPRDTERLHSSQTSSFSYYDSGRVSRDCPALPLLCAHFLTLVMNNDMPRIGRMYTDITSLGENRQKTTQQAKQYIKGGGKRIRRDESHTASAMQSSLRAGCVSKGRKSQRRLLLPGER